MSSVATYSKNFDAYFIKKLDDYDMILVDDGICSDVLNSDIKELVFSDTTKNFHELLGANEDKNTLIIDENFSHLADISVIRLIVRGYDESLDRLSFDAGLLNLSKPYKYSISDGGIEIRLDIIAKDSDINGFLSTIKYEYFSTEFSSDRTIFIYADADLVFTKRLKVSKKDQI